MRNVSTEHLRFPPRRKQQNGYIDFFVRWWDFDQNALLNNTTACMNQALPFG
jgi:hypothetical protein